MKNTHFLAKFIRSEDIDILGLTLETSLKKTIYSLPRRASIETLFMEENGDCIQCVIVLLLQVTPCSCSKNFLPCIYVIAW